ncbi:unnamed protein product [Chondrus crispus]|uniref:Uncharacterized protein n=1 Tax=Chondrus crispus TaxID=2769 RepID=R7QTV4_CHOCR|nr:unnamed protein product [Chondrus crispus]CDF40805.1 unnamed protein product [Chondrus crispus]|eukprot:XP_005711099.1 unnamed protein product [Chondrus crispus]
MGLHSPQSFAIALTERQRQAVVPRATRACKSLKTTGNLLEGLPLGESKRQLHTGGRFDRPRRKAWSPLQPVSQKQQSELLYFSCYDTGTSFGCSQLYTVRITVHSQNNPVELHMLSVASFAAQHISRLLKPFREIEEDRYSKIPIMQKRFLNHSSS